MTKRGEKSGQWPSKKHKPQYLEKGGLSGGRKNYVKPIKAAMADGGEVMPPMRKNKPPVKTGLGTIKDELKGKIPPQRL